MSTETTPNLALPLLVQNQSGKELTHNEALAIIDALLNNGIIDKDLTTPPSSPANGQAYIVGTSSTDLWSSKDEQIAFYNNGWEFIVPREGLTLWINDEDCLYTYNGTSWVKTTNENSSLDNLSDVIISSPAQYDLLSHNGTNFVNTQEIQNLDLVGINTTADTNNKLAVASDYILFNRATNNIRIKANKNASTDTASHLFQTNYSGRAEFGLIGNDDFTLKVSADGSSWNDAFVIDKDNGNVDFKGNLSINGNSIGIEKVSEIVISNNSYIEFTGLDDGYSYFFIFENIQVATDNVAILAQISRDGGTTYVNSGYNNLFGFVKSGTTSRYEYDGTSEASLVLSSTNTFQTNSGIGNGTGENFNGRIDLINPSDTSNTKLFKVNGTYIDSTGNLVDLGGSGILTGSQSAYNTIKFYAESGNLGSGVIKCYKNI
jgi:hypothetical protein